MRHALTFRLPNSHFPILPDALCLFCPQPATRNLLFSVTCNLSSAIWTDCAMPFLPVTRNSQHATRLCIMQVVKYVTPFRRLRQASLAIAAFSIGRTRRMDKTVNDGLSILIYPLLKTLLIKFAAIRTLQFQNVIIRQATVMFERRIFTCRCMHSSCFV